MSVSRDVDTTLNYYVQTNDDDGPYLHPEGPPVGIPTTNVRYHAYTTVVHDARGKPTDVFGLDVTGFEWVTYPSEEKAFVDEERIETVYYAEVEDILKKHTGAKRVFIFNRIIRRPQDGDVPAHHVHVDQSLKGAELRLRYFLPDEAERLLNGRYQIINVWRPIKNPVVRDPLCVADFRSIDRDADLVPVLLNFRFTKGEMYSTKYNPGHRWYYLSDQTPDEVTLIKCFDSDLDKARFTLHSAFPDKTCPVDAPLRQSIEVRAFVFDTE